MSVFAEAAGRIGRFDDKDLPFDRVLELVAARATKEIEKRWMRRLAGLEVFAEDHVRAARVQNR